METTGEVDVDVKPVPSLFELSEKQIIDACDKGECEEDQLIRMLDWMRDSGIRFLMVKLIDSVARALFAIDPESSRATSANGALITDFLKIEKDILHVGPN